jgi:predicted nucleic acid-binding protein
MRAIVFGKVEENGQIGIRGADKACGILLPDALVAASAKQNDAVLVTLNGKHYPMKDIEVMVPYTKV